MKNVVEDVKVQICYHSDAGTRSDNGLLGNYIMLRGGPSNQRYHRVDVLASRDDLNNRQSMLWMRSFGLEL